MEQFIKAVPYYRVSTSKQGESGLGLEAQKKSVEDYAASRGLILLPECIEVESGKRKNRPVLKEALALCEKEKAILLIAKLDRLARNVKFIATLMESDTEFIAVDYPQASRLILHILAAFAQYEGEEISKRTKAALAAAKARGVRLGTYGRLYLSMRNEAIAIAFAYRMKLIIDGLKKEGYTTLRALTHVMNERNIAPYSGNNAKWHLRSVALLMKRIKQLKIPSNENKDCSGIADNVHGVNDTGTG